MNYLETIGYSYSHFSQELSTITGNNKASTFFTYFNLEHMATGSGSSQHISEFLFMHAPLLLLLKH